VSRITIFNPRANRHGRTRPAPPFSFRYSLTKRLELLRESRAGATRTSQQFRARAEEFRLQAETFRDPKTRAQMLNLAANYERRATQAEELETSR
jgi:hypothetical protein